MLPIELALRGVNAGLGLLGLMLLLNAGGLLREFALFLPVGFTVSLIIDAGRTELILKHGLRESLASSLPRKLAFAGAASAASVLGASWLSLGTSAVVTLSVVLSAIAQVYVDMALRHSLYRRRSVLFVSWFQFACAAINALLAYLGREGLVTPEQAVASLVVTPAAVALTVRRQLLRGATPDVEGAGVQGGSPVSARSRGVALAFRIAPSVAYSVYLLALRLLAPPLEATARALYFVFGFLHIRAMARHRQATWTRTAALLAVVALVTSVPLLVFDRPGEGAPGPGDLGWGAILLAVSSLAGAKYLDLYGKFLNGR